MNALAVCEPIGLTLESIRKTYRRSGFSLDVPHMDVPAGSTLALLGPSGCGKSTLLEIAGLLAASDEGRVLLDGVGKTTHDRAARMVMAAVFQQAYLLKATVAKNVAYGLRLRRIDGSTCAVKVSEALEVVGLAGFENRAAGTLSGGEAQRVSLARALVLEPRILLLDEPLSSLDPILKQRMQQEFGRILHDRGVTAIYVTHDPDEAMTVADSIAILRDGRVVTTGSAEEVIGVPPDAWTALFLGVEPSLSGKVVASEGGLIQVDCAGVKLAAVSSEPMGTQVQLGIRPEDIILFRAGEYVPLSSARNRIAGRVDWMSRRGATWHVVVECGGVRLAVSLSRVAAAELEIEVGSEVVALFKATAVCVGAACVRGQGQE